MNFKALLSLFLILSLTAPQARASCGAASCPMDAGGHEPSAGGRLRLDASYQYLDQDQPLAGRRKAAVGDVPNPEHNEISTLNRIWAFRADYDATSRWGVSLALPVINRAHDHLAVDTGEVEHWGFTGVGDLSVVGRYQVLDRAGAQEPGLTLELGAKFPTGRLGAHNDDESAEVTIQPGTGSYDLIAGAGYAQSVGSVPTLGGDWARLPVYVGLRYKQNNPGKDAYRFGDEVQINAGTAYPLAPKLELLAQANARFKMRDYNGSTGEDTSFTGGSFLYISPGLRVQLGRGLSAYGYVQLPVYQRVNQEQIVSRRNLVLGLTWECGGR